MSASIFETKITGMQKNNTRALFSDHRCCVCNGGCCFKLITSTMKSVYGMQLTRPGPETNDLIDN